MSGLCSGGIANVDLDLSSRRISEPNGPRFRPTSAMRCGTLPPPRFTSAPRTKCTSLCTAHSRLSTFDTIGKMGVKRSADKVEGVAPPLRREHSKRTKMSPSAEEGSNSSVPSSCSVSEASALQSSPPASAHERNSSMSSLEAADSDGDSESSISSDSHSDSSDPDSDGDEDEDIVTIGGPKKPNISRLGATDEPEDLRTRIAALLPKLEEANSLLTSEGGQYSMEDVEDGEQYIEMNLGLGVLEQQDEDDDSSSDSSSEDEDDDRPGEELDLLVSSGALKRSPQDKETKRMKALTGNRSEQTRSGIEEIG